MRSRVAGLAGVLLTTITIAGCGSSASPSAAPQSSASSSVPASTSKVPSPAEASAAADLERAIGATRDQAFLGILQISSLQYGQLKFADAAGLVAVAQKSCTDLQAGRPRTSVVGDVAQNYGGDSTRADYFVTQATSSYCPEVAGPR